MPRNMTDSTHSELADRALEEAMALLADVRFSTVRGAYRQGELSAVSVMLEEDSEAGVHHIRVMCHDPGHLGIDWDGLPLYLIERPGLSATSAGAPHCLRRAETALRSCRPLQLEGRLS